SSRRRHTRFSRDWSSDVCSSDLRLTQELLRCAELIQSHWLFMAVLAAGSGGLILWSLSNASGPLRRKLDRHAVWRIYRYIQALRSEERRGGKEWEARREREGGDE